MTAICVDGPLKVGNASGIGTKVGRVSASGVVRGEGRKKALEKNQSAKTKTTHPSGLLYGSGGVPRTGV